MITVKKYSLRVWVEQPKDVPTLLLCVVSPKHGGFFF